MIRNFSLLSNCINSANRAVADVEPDALRGQNDDLRTSYQDFMNGINELGHDLDAYHVREIYHIDLLDEDEDLVDSAEDVADDFADDYGMDKKIADSRTLGESLLVQLDETIRNTSPADPSFTVLNRQRAQVCAILHGYECCEAENAARQITDNARKEVDTYSTELQTYDRLESEGVNFVMALDADPEDSEYTEAELAMFSRLDTLKSYSVIARTADMKKEYPALEAAVADKRAELAADPDCKALFSRYASLKNTGLETICKVMDGKNLSGGNMSQAERDFVREHRAGFTKLMDLKVLEEKKVLLAKAQPDEYRSMIRDRADAAAAASGEHVRTQFAAMAQQLAGMRKFGMNTGDFRRFRDALDAAANGGDVKALADAANAYIREKTNGGKSEPSSENGKARLAMARAAALLAGTVNAQNETVAAEKAKLTQGFEKVQASGVDRIAEAGAEAAEAGRRLAKMSAGDAPLTAEEQAEAAEMILRTASDKLIQISTSSPVAASLLNNLRRDPRMADQFIGSARTRVNDAFFTAEAPLTRERLREISAMTPEQLLDTVNRAAEQKADISREQDRAMRAMTSPESTPAQLKEAAASLLACRTALKNFDGNRDQMAVIDDAKQKLNADPAFNALTADAAALRQRFISGNPAFTVARLAQELGQRTARMAAARNSQAPAVNVNAPVVNDPARQPVVPGKH